MKTPGDVLSFWFGDAPTTSDDLKAKMKKWFLGGAEMDEATKRELGAETEAALGGKLDAWLALPERDKGWLALLIVLDQLTRNIYRNDARTHAGDARAQKLCIEALDNGKLHALPMQERHFALMPLLHSESAEHQARYQIEYAKFMSDVPETFRHIYSGGVEQGEKYADIIRRFGRFPHRNVILGRTSTKEEEDFLVDWADKRAPKVARELEGG
jgi:uncharacterized protein (DUF924 family)